MEDQNITMEERNDELRQEIQQHWQNLGQSQQERAATESTLKETEDILECVDLLNKENSGDLQQISAYHNRLVDDAKSLYEKTVEINKKLERLEQQLEKCTIANLFDEIVSDISDETEIRRLEERIKVQAEQIAIKITNLNRKEDELRKLENKLEKARQSERLARLEMEHRDSKRNAKKEAWIKKKAAIMRNIEDMRTEYTNNMTALDSEILLIQREIVQGRREYRADMERYKEINKELVAEREFFKEWASKITPKTTKKQRTPLSLR